METDFLLDVIWSAVAVLAGLVIYSVLIGVVKRAGRKRFEAEKKTAALRSHVANPATLKARKTFFGLLKSLIRICFIVAVTLAVLAINGVDVGSVLAGLGILSVVLGLALQDALKDIIRGITIVIEKYYQVGDVATINGITGVVQSVGMLTTKMTDWNDGGALVSIANRNIEVASVRTGTRYLKVALPHDLPQSEIDSIFTHVAAVASKHEKVESCEYLGVSEIEGRELKHEFKVVSAPTDAATAKRAVLKNIVDALERHKLALPYEAVEVKQARDLR